MAVNEKKRRALGFTMMETLMAVVIIAILMGLVFVGVMNYRRSMLHLEVDATAKEIYIAAQSHLSSGHRQGQLKNYNDAHLGSKEGSSDIHYFVYATDGDATSRSYLSKSDYSLGLMLPLSSIDDTVRTGGSYIVRYQPSSGRVLDVFYAKPGGIGGLFGAFGAHTFSAGEYEDVLATADVWDADGVLVTDNSSARENYGTDGSVIGYYGGEMANNTPTLKLTNPSIVVENGDVLRVSILNPHENTTAINGVSGASLKLVLLVKGVTSGAEMYFDLAGADAAKYPAKDLQTYEVTLDDVTASTKFTGAKRFSELIQDRKTVGKIEKKGSTLVDASDMFFIPGEDLEIQAYVAVTGALAEVKDSGKSITNSLFANGSKANGTNAYNAKIDSFRHLINLQGGAASGDSWFNDYVDAGVTKQRYTDVTANQIRDLTWPDFTKNTGFETSTGSGDDATTTPKSMPPVSPTYALDYSGRSGTEGDTKNHAISNVKVEVEGNAGLFGVLPSASKVANLEVRDCNVTAKGTGNNAGALVGKAAGSITLQNVLVRDSSASTTSLVKSEAGHVGGLVGQLDATSGTIMVDGCAAAVFVQATGTAEGTSAGGLVGNAKGSVTIQNSSVGGHMTNGSFATNPNITSAQVAGGLIGSGANTTIKNSYATCSIADQGTLGGLAGSLTNATVNNSYAACFVVSDAASTGEATANYATKGGFAGSVDEATTLDDKCTYLEVLNGAMPALGSNSKNSAATTLAPFDKNTETYEAMCGAVAEDAAPYYTDLGTNYLYKTMDELSGSDAVEGKWSSSHYGDWPDVETEVVNTKTQSAAPTGQTLHTGYVPARTSAAKPHVATARATVRAAKATANVSVNSAWTVQGFVDAAWTKWLAQARSVLPSTTDVPATEGKGESEGDTESDPAKEDAPKSDEAAEDADKQDSPEMPAPGDPAQNATSEAPTAEPEPQPSAKQLEATITSIDGHTYTVRVMYGDEAGIPEGAELSVTEINQRPADFYDADKRDTYKDRPLETELLVGEEDMQSRMSKLTEALELNDGDLLMWNKLLNVAITLNGEPISFAGDVTVEVETNALEVTASDTLEAVLFGTGDAFQPAVSNTTGTAEGEAAKKPEELVSRIAFTTDALGELGLAQVSEEKFAWKMENNEAYVYGARSIKASPTSFALDLSLADGRQLVEAFTLAVDPTHEFDTTLWISATHTGGASSYDNVVGYRVTEGEPEQLFATATADGLVPIVANDAIALVWESGYYQTTLRNGDVVVAGEMPAGATVSANDVLDEFTDPAKLGEGVAAPQTVVAAAYSIGMKDGNGADYVPGEEHPAFVEVTNVLAQAGKLAVFRMGEKGAAEVASSQVSDSSVGFVATEPGTYVVTYTVQTYHKEATGDSWKVSASYTEESGIPGDAEFVVRELTGKEYDAYVDEAAKALGKDPKDVKITKAFDISFKKGDEEYHELDESVHVTIDLLNQDVASGTKVIHVDEEPTVKVSSVENGVLSFDSSEFSTFLLAQDGDNQNPEQGTDPEQGTTTQVTLSFVNGETVLSTASVASGQPIGEHNIPADPTKEGYTLGWYVEGSDTPITAESTFETDANLYARYTYTVTFEAEGVENPPAAFDVFEGKPVGELPTPERDGYRFVGWFYEDVLEQEEREAEATTVFKGHTTLTAHFVEQVTITFMADGVEKEARPIDKGAAVGTLPDAPAEDCDFVGWFIEGEDDPIVATRTFDESTTVTAHYTVDVTFLQKNADYTEVTSTKEVKGINKGDAVGSKFPGNPELQGYDFKGWFVVGQDGKPTDQQITKDTPILSHTTVVAKFVKQVTITFIDTTSGETGTRQEFTVDEGDDVRLITNPYVAGSRFDGWFEGDVRRTNALGLTDENGNLVDKDWVALPEGAAPVRVIKATRNMELTSRFVAQITVRFIGIDFVNTSSSTGLPSINVHERFVMDQTIAGLEADPFPEDPTMSGYEFEGWYGVKQYGNYPSYSQVPAADRMLNKVFVLTNDASSTPYVLDETKPVDATTKFDTTTDVVAKFTKKVSVTFNYGEDQKPATYLSGQPLSLHIPAEAQKDGFRLEWHKNDAVVPDDYVVQDEDDNAIFTAHYTEESTITFKVGESNYATLTVDKGTSAQQSNKTWPNDPTNPDAGSTAHFIGWYSSDNQKYDNDTVVSAKNVELTAKFGYTVTFYSETDDTEALTSREVQAGTVLGWLPTAPYKQGHTFKTWVVDDTPDDIANYTPIDASYVVNSNVSAYGTYEKISIYTITINYTIDGVAKDTKMLTLDKSTISVNNPEVVPSPTSFSQSGGIYYPVMQALQIVPEENTLGVKDKHAEVTVKVDQNSASKITITVPYKQADADYKVTYMLKDLTGDGYTEIEHEDLRGVKGASVMPEVKEYDYAVFERSETGIITQLSGNEFKVYYTRKKFTLTYNAKGGVNLDAVSKLYGEVQESHETPTRDGYDFVGWYRNEDYSGPKVEVDQPITIDSDITLFAKWSPKSVDYTIVYMKQKYDNSPDATDKTPYVYDRSVPASGQVGTEVTAASAPAISMNGYEIDEEENESNAASKITIAADGSSVLLVHYKLIRYTLVFNVKINNGRITMNGRTYTGSNYKIENVVVGQDVSAYWPATSSEIYDSSNRNKQYFGGWNDGYHRWLQLTKVGEIDYEYFEGANNQRTVTWTAQWESSSQSSNAEYWLQQPDGTYAIDESYTQTGVNTTNLGAKEIAGYTVFNGTPLGYPSSGNTVVTDDVVYVPEHVEERDVTDYHDDPWEYDGVVWRYVGSYGGGWFSSPHYVYQGTVPGHYQMVTAGSSTYTFRFYYSRAKYKIDYYYGSAELTTKSDIFFGANINNPTYDYVPDRPAGMNSDYTWGGWYADSECTTPYEFKTMPGSNLKLYAKWITPTYPVTFHLNYDGATPEPYFYKENVEKYAYVTTGLSQDDQNKLSDPGPAPAHYVFDGWYTEAEDGENFAPAGTRITAETHVYAHWKPKGVSYTVKYLRRVGNEYVDILPSKTVTGSLVVGQEITEYAPYVTGFHLSDEDPNVTMMANVGSQTITLDYEDNEIVFIYNKKPETIKYTVKYVVLNSDPEIEVADSVEKEVSGSYTSVTETAVTPTAIGYEDYYPTEVTKSKALGYDAAQNVITFYYTKGARITVSYVDMEGDPIPNKLGFTTYQEVGETFNLETALPGYTLSRIVKNAETTTETSFTPTSINDAFDIQVYYKYKLSITARNQEREYNGAYLTDEGVYDNATENPVSKSYVIARGLKNTDARAHTLTGITITGSRKDVGFAYSVPSDAKISGLKEGVAASDFYDITYNNGYLSVTPVNVTISLEPDRWTGNIYNGKEWPTGFTNPKKNIDDYVIITARSDFKQNYLSQLWAGIVAYLETEGSLQDGGKAVPSGTLEDGTPGLAVIQGNKDVGDYYERVDTFIDALDEAVDGLDLGNRDNYKIVQYARECHLEILPLPVTITTEGGEKPYDGTPLTSNVLTVVTDDGSADAPHPIAPDLGTNNYKLTENENRVAITTSGSQTRPGSSRNTYTIDWGDEVATNYAITENLGELKVNKSAITIDVQDAAKPYNTDDPSYTVKVFYDKNGVKTEIPSSLTYWPGIGYTLQLNDANAGFTDNIPISITRTEQGETPGVYKIEATSREGADENYDITYEEGYLTIAIARVRKKGDTEWTYHQWLVHDGKGSEQGAFNRAAELTGDVTLETLCETAHVPGEEYDRYALLAGQSVVKEQNLTIRTTQEPLWNPKGSGHFDSIISRAFTGDDSMLTLNQSTSSLTITNIILDGGSESDYQCTGFGAAVKALLGTGLTLRKATVRNCFATNNGGGIYTFRTFNNTVMNEVKLDNCVVTGNGQGHSGGGAYFFGSATANCVTVTNCRSEGDKGGGIYFYGPDSKLGVSYSYTDDNGKSVPVSEPCVFQNCSAALGGGGLYFYSKGGEVIGTQKKGISFTSCTTSSNGGGGLAFADTNDSSSTTNRVSYTTFNGCSSNGSGGALYVSKSDSEITNVSITDCYAGSNGGSVWIGNSSTFTDVTIDGHVLRDQGLNSAQNGGAIYANGGTLTLSGKTIIRDCKVTGNGGGIYLNNASLSMTEGTPRITECTAGNAGAIFLTGSSADAQISTGTITGNVASGYGGGAMRLEGGSTAEISGNAWIGSNRVTKNNSQEKYGGAINIKKGTLTISGGTISYNSVEGDGQKEASGGAIHVSGYHQNNPNDDGKLIITGGTISSNTVSSNGNVYGGAISLRGSTAEVTISGGTIEGNSASATRQGKIAQGGAIHLRDGAILNLSGGTFNGNTADATTASNAKGAGIYVEPASTLNISGAPTFGSGGKANTIKISGYASKLNGGDAVYEKDQVRQDIYIAEAREDAPQTVKIKGALTGSEGSIWVWAESPHHHKQLMPFAVMDGVTFGTAEGNLNPNQLKVFRNAQDDDTTENKTESYLYGKNEGKTQGYAYWSGISGRRRVILQKVGGDGMPLEGAQLSVYRGNTATDPLTVTITDGTTTTTQTLQNLPSGKSGVFWVGELTYGTYYLHETTAPTASGYAGNAGKWFCMIIDANGTFMSENGYANSDAATAKKAALDDATAVQAAAGQ